MRATWVHIKLQTRAAREFDRPPLTIKRKIVMNINEGVLGEKQTDNSHSCARRLI